MVNSANLYMGILYARKCSEQIDSLHSQLAQPPSSNSQTTGSSSSAFVSPKYYSDLLLHHHHHPQQKGETLSPRVSPETFVICALL